MPMELGRAVSDPGTDVDTEAPIASIPNRLTAFLDAMLQLGERTDNILRQLEGPSPQPHEKPDKSTPGSLINHLSEVEAAIMRLERNVGRIATAFEV